MSGIMYIFMAISWGDRFLMYKNRGFLSMTGSSRWRPCHLPQHPRPHHPRHLPRRLPNRPSLSLSTEAHPQPPKRRSSLLGLLLRHARAGLLDGHGDELQVGLILSARAVHAGGDGEQEARYASASKSAGCSTDCKFDFRQYGENHIRSFFLFSVPEPPSPIVLYPEAGNHATHSQSSGISCSPS